MRQPKFRGISRESNKWYYGYGWFKTDFTEEYKKEKGIEDFAILLTDGGTVECKLESMGEFVGVIDENDIEIYEGDITNFILRQHDGKFIGVVEFNDGMFKVTLPNEDSATINIAYEDFSYYNALKFEVVGNLTENPELFKPVLRRDI